MLGELLPAELKFEKWSKGQKRNSINIQSQITPNRPIFMPGIITSNYEL